MGICPIYSGKKTVNRTVSTKIQTNKENQKHFEVLHQLFKDLALRNSSFDYIEKSTFLSFFKIPGYLGERMFSILADQEDFFLRFEKFSHILQVMCTEDTDSLVSIVFEACDTENTKYLSIESLKVLFYSFFYSCKEFTSLESAEKQEELHTTNKELLSSFLQDIQKVSEDWLKLSLFEVIQEIFKKYADCGLGINLSQFSLLLSSFPSISLAISQSFTQDIWTTNAFPLISIPKMLKPSENKEKIYETVYILKDHSLLKYSIAFKGPLLVLISQEKQKSIEQVVFLEDCYLKLASKFSVWLLNIFYTTQYDPRLTLAFRTEEKQLKWLQRISQIGSLNKLKDFYTIDNKLSHGKYSEIYLAYNKQSKQRFIAKIIRKRKLSYIEREMIKNETNILNSLSHKNIVQLFDVFHGQKSVVLILEHLEGVELTKLIKSSDLSETHIKSIIYQLLVAVNYLHEVNIIHRDIKPENVIIQNVDNNFRVKLIDFGFASFDIPLSLSLIHCGTLGYSAPEILKRETYGKAVDIWSIGIIAYSMITKNLPIYSSDHKVVISKTINLEIDYSAESWKMYSSSALDFVRSLLKNSTSRLTAKTALAHPWLSST